MKNEAINANLEAQKAIERCLIEHKSDSLVKDSILIKHHALVIKNGMKWDNSND